MKQQNRWAVAAVGVVILLFAGIVYAWSVLSAPIAQEFPQWSKAQLSLTFTIVMILFCLGCLAGGLVIRRLPPQAFCLISAVLFLAGFCLASVTHGLALLYLGFGVLCGFASGFVYSAALSTVGKWFPDRQGLISGILLMGFGISSFLAGKLYQATLVNWRTSFRVLGIISCVALVLCSFLLRKPDASFVPPKAAGQKVGGARRTAQDVPPRQMVKDPSFWLYFAWAILLSAAGLALVSQAGGIVREASAALDAGTAATIIGLISVLNGVGRIFYGARFDRRGRNATMQLVNCNFAVAAVVLILALRAGSVPLVVLGFVLGGFAYGGVTPTHSAFVSSYYGMKHYPVNFSLINTNLILASFGSTAAGALYDATGSFRSVFLAIIALAALGAGLSQAIALRDRRGAHGA